MKLLSQNLQTLVDIDFGGVKLKSGEWQTIFKLLCPFPKLINFTVWALTYTEDGRSRRYAPREPAPEENQAPIESKYDGDWDAFEELEKITNAKRQARGLKPYTSSDYFTPDLTLW